jgi:hypothetical protein
VNASWADLRAFQTNASLVPLIGKLNEGFTTACSEPLPSRRHAGLPDPPPAAPAIRQLLTSVSGALGHVCSSCAH